MTTDRDRFTDRDSDESEKDKEMEREYLAAVEKAEQIKEKFEKQKQTRSARRIRTGRTAADIFADDSSEAQYNQLERDWTRGSSSSTRGPSGRLRRVKTCSPPSGEAAFTTKSGRSLPREGRSINSSVNSSTKQWIRNFSIEDSKEEDEQEDEEMVGRGDFRGFHAKDPNSRLRKIISRNKKQTLSDPVMKGKIMNATGGRGSRFCCDSGCSANIMTAKMVTFVFG